MKPEIDFNENAVSPWDLLVRSAICEVEIINRPTSIGRLSTLSGAPALWYWTRPHADYLLDGQNPTYCHTLTLIATGYWDPPPTQVVELMGPSQNDFENCAILRNGGRANELTRGNIMVLGDDGRNIAHSAYILGHTQDGTPQVLERPQPNTYIWAGTPLSYLLNAGDGRDADFTILSPPQN